MIIVNEIVENVNLTVNEVTDNVLISVDETSNDITVTVAEINNNITVQVSEIITPVTIEIAEMGLQGLTGKSNYQVAVDNGFTGTQTQWLESQKNIDGGLIF